ncbi:MAG: tol-pal system protein YbgF [Deltaproteobacteria bacterium]|nr:tol-pal system protein YbgF [Deltaproteobacteria bacterium]
MRRCLCALIIIVFLSMTGCATTNDLRRVHSDLNRQIQVTNEKIASVEQGWSPLRGEIAGVRNEIAKDHEAIQLLRGSQAEGRAEMTDIREQLQQIRGTVDGLRKDLLSAASRTVKREEEEKVLREKLDNLTFRINFIESFLGIGKNEEPAAAPAGKVVKQPAAAPAKETAGKGRTDKESVYAAAYELFKEAKYEKSREAFENFLKQYPGTEFSDNAQFWIGECYYFEKKYEKAIIEYDKVTKNFPGGNKVPYALLKQGLSFLKLGDKASGKLLLQQVTKDYPNTSQARIARAKLLEIK